MYACVHVGERTLSCLHMNKADLGGAYSLDLFSGAHLFQWAGLIISAAPRSTVCHHSDFNKKTLLNSIFLSPQPHFNRAAQIRTCSLDPEGFPTQIGPMSVNEHAIIHIYHTSSSNCVLLYVHKNREMCCSNVKQNAAQMKGKLHSQVSAPVC